MSACCHVRIKCGTGDARACAACVEHCLHACARVCMASAASADIAVASPRLSASPVRMPLRWRFMQVYSAPRCRTRCKHTTSTAPSQQRCYAATSKLKGTETRERNSCGGRRSLRNACSFFMPSNPRKHKERAEADAKTRSTAVASAVSVLSEYGETSDPPMARLNRRIRCIKWLARVDRSSSSSSSCGTPSK